MKYVRVYEGDYVESEYLTTYEQHCRHVAEIQDNGFDFEGCIVKQADTIEELCDVYVIVPQDIKYEPYTVKTLNLFDDVKSMLDTNDIYASIWVDALLKPVAKMNDKGELELL